MTRHDINAILTLAALAALPAGGCASRGFVRGEIATLRQDTQRLERDTRELRTDLDAVRNSSDEALARAESAYQAAFESREVALGRMGFREIETCTVGFDFDSDALTQEACAALDGVARQVLERPDLLVDVYGFTDSAGPDLYNLQLGQRRADAVMRYLVEFTPGQLRRYAAVSYGEGKPAVPEVEPGADGRNRRVVVALIERVPLDEPAGRPEPVSLLGSAEM